MELTPLNYFKDIHQDKFGFVCGAGTSLNNIPKSISEKGVIICINSAGLYFDSFDYLFVTDPAVFNMSYFNEVLEKSKFVILANPELEGYAKKIDKDKVYLMTRCYEDHSNYSFNDVKLCLGTDAAIPATHLAYVMGFKEIFLCGIDLCYQNNNRYFTEKSFIHNPDSPYKESFEKDYKTGKIVKEYTTDIWLDMSIGCWQNVYNQNSDKVHKILNTSSISQVKGFKKINLEEYF